MPVEKNKEGKITKRHRIMYWRNYEQTLITLLSDVNYTIKVNEICIPISFFLLTR